MKYKNKTKAAILFKKNSKLKIIKNYSFPKLSNGQILVKIIYSSLCGSQIMEIDGKRGLDKYLPHALGHEAVAKVVQVGKSVKKVKKNNLVILTWIKTSGKNESGIKLIYSQKINAGPITTLSNYAVISENRCIKKPKSLPLKIAAIFGCCVFTGSGIVYKYLSKRDKNLKICIIGLGGVGMATALALLSLNIKNIHFIETNKKKFKLAKKLNLKILEEKDFKKNNLFDYCFESAGSSKTIELGFKLIKNNGKLIISSHPIYKSLVKFDPYGFILGKKVIGNWGGNANPEKNIKKYAKLYLNKKLPLDILVNKSYKLENINKCIKDYKEGKIIKPIIKM